MKLPFAFPAGNSAFVKGFMEQPAHQALKAPCSPASWEEEKFGQVSLPPRAHELVLVCIHGVVLPVDCLMVVVPPSKRRTYILLMWHLILWSVVLLSFTGYFSTCCLPCFSHWRSIKPSNLRWLDKQGYSAEVDSLNVEITVRDGGGNYCTVLWLAFISFWNRNKMAWQSFNFKWKTHIRKTMIKNGTNNHSKCKPSKSLIEIYLKSQFTKGFLNSCYVLGVCNLSPSVVKYCVHTEILMYLLECVTLISLFQVTESTRVTPPPEVRPLVILFSIPYFN